MVNAILHDSVGAIAHQFGELRDPPETLLDKRTYLIWSEQDKVSARENSDLKQTCCIYCIHVFPNQNPRCRLQTPYRVIALCLKQQIPWLTRFPRFMVGGLGPAPNMCPLPTMMLETALRWTQTWRESRSLIARTGLGGEPSPSIL